ncbi:hypothetical protein DFH09DRAFT_1093054 [Mycena vulgaris]|nr:hypothetical protein DFH09DRAFT_1093054 [Mycena vulgaris]
MAEAEESVRVSIEDAAAVQRVVVEQAVFVTGPSQEEGETHDFSKTKDFDAKTTDKFIGSVGASTLGRARLSCGSPSCRARVGTASRSEGSECGSVPPFDRLVIECDPRNVRSSRLAERAGFVLESVTEKAFECKGEWVGTMVYSRGLDVAA